MTTLQELLARKASLEAEAKAIDDQLRAARLQERQAAIAQIKSLLAQNGLTVADLGLKATRGAAKGRPVPAKYRNQATGESWSGRGLKPKWVKAALADGKSLEDLLI